MENLLNTVELKWDAYKRKSGKWYAGSIINIPATILPWDTALLIEYIDNNNDQLIVGSIKENEFILVIEETEYQLSKVGYNNFYKGILNP